MTDAEKKTVRMAAGHVGRMLKLRRTLLDLEKGVLDVLAERRAEVESSLGVVSQRLAALAVNDQ